MATKQHFHVCKSSTFVHGQRRSPRFQKLASAAQKEVRSIGQIPSPSPSRSVVDVPRASRKRKCSDEITSNEVGRHAKRQQVVQEVTKSSQLTSCPIAHWVETSKWPESYGQGRPAMSLTDSNKRKSSSTHHSDRQQRLEENGVFMRTSAQLQKASKTLCEDLLKGIKKPKQYPYYPAEKTDDVLERVQRLNEARLQRDVTPWIVPSPENLYFSGELELDYLGEEVQAEWIRILPLSGTKPKPDFTVGLQRRAFTGDELIKLEYYTTLDTPSFFTPDLCFPFLICEAKTGRAGLGNADVQNIHSGSLAVRAIVMLFTAAYGANHQKTTDLFGRILAFSVSHDNRQVNLFGHYAVAGGGMKKGDFQYFHHRIDMFSLDLHDGKQRYNAYNFARNVFDHFAPSHLKRIQDALGQMKMPGQHTVSASEPAVDDERLSQSASLQQEGIFKTPSEPTSVATKRLIEQVERSEWQRDTLLQQLSEARQERKEERDLLNKLLRESKEERDKERKESKEKEERMERQMERMEREMERLMTIVSTVSEAKNPS